MSSSDELFPPSPLNYKFRDLKVYASTEWLADGKKKYRRVFENEEVSYLYVELSIFNKLFDQEDWNTKVKLVCYRFVQDGREEICNIIVEKQVTEVESVCYVREGWGHATPGQYWKKGNYLWEAYIAEELPITHDTPQVNEATSDDKEETVAKEPSVDEKTFDYRLLGSTTFYIEDAGVVNEDDNPYFDVNHIRLYEGSSDGISLSERKYLVQFSTHDTRYVWVEFCLENMLSYGWHAEIIFNFYNSAGQLKGSTSELRFIREEEDEVTLVTGWGSDTQGTWFNDRYTLEVVFMDKRVAVVPFKCSESPIEGTPKILMGDEIHLDAHIEEPEQQEEEVSLEDLMRQLGELVGLKGIKKQVHDYLEYLEFL